MSNRGNTVEMPFMPAEAWDGSPECARFHDTVEFQVVSLTGGPFTPQRNLEPTLGGTFDSCTLFDQLNNDYTSLTTNEVGKIFSGDGRAVFQLKPTSPTDRIKLLIRKSS